MEPVYVFVSYPRERSEDLNSFLIHTADLARNGVEFFYDERIPWGEEWERKILQKIDSAHIFIALVSANYVASVWCMKELARALARRGPAGCAVLPVRVAPFDTAPGSPLQMLQLLPSGKPIIQRGSRKEESWAEVAAALRQQVASMRGDHPVRIRPGASAPHMAPQPGTGSRLSGRIGHSTTVVMSAGLAVLVVIGLVWVVWLHKPQAPGHPQPDVLYTVSARTLRVSNTPLTCGVDKFDLDTDAPGHGNQPQLNLCRNAGRLADLILDPERLHTPDDDRRLLLVDDTGTLDFRRCSDLLGTPEQRLVGSIPLSELSVGRTLCLKTDEGLVARVTIVDLSAGGNGTLTFDATVWRST